MNGAREQPRRQKLINDDEPSAPSSAFNNVYYKKKDKKEVKNEKGAAFAAFLDRHTDEQPAWKHLDSESALKMMGDDAKRDINKMLPLMGDINGYNEDQEAPEEYKPRKSKHSKGQSYTISGQNFVVSKQLVTSKISKNCEIVIHRFTIFSQFVIFYNFSKFLNFCFVVKL